MPTQLEQLASWASVLELTDVPPRVVEYAKSQVLSHVAAVRASLSHPVGATLVRAFGPPSAGDPKSAAHLLATLGTALEYDDSIYGGHVSHSTVGVPLAYARHLRLGGAEVLTAVIAANECAARVGAAVALGPFRGQAAAHPHLCGAVAGRLRAEAVDARQWVDALGIALSSPPWLLTPAFVSSDAKLLTAAHGVRLGLDACDAARAGLKGAADIVECPGGFVERFSDVPLPHVVSKGLGDRWHTETLTLKPYPVATGVHAAAECAVALNGRIGRRDPAEFADVAVHATLLALRADAIARAQLSGSSSPLSALQYAMPYCLATALLTGKVTVADFVGPALEEPDRWALASRIRTEHDPALTRRAVMATVPLGEALREAGEDQAEAWAIHAGGPHARGLVHGLGPPSTDFQCADKAIGARVVVRLANGAELTEVRIRATGMAGPETRRRHRAIARAKLSDVAPDGARLIARLECMETLDSSEMSETIEAWLGAVDGRDGK